VACGEASEKASASPSASFSLIQVLSFPRGAVCHRLVQWSGPLEGHDCRRQGLTALPDERRLRRRLAGGLANGMPMKEVPLAASADRRTLKFPADALYVVLQ
jgi:hypothetical protein